MEAPKLDSIGFYTLSEARLRQACATSPLWRGELILTGRCNFRCPYCRHVVGRDLGVVQALATIHLWLDEGLKHIRFSGGEPTLYRELPLLVTTARLGGIGVNRIALSTNGSAPLSMYEHLLECGVNDLSISLDACCAEDGDKMAGGVRGAWEHVCENIRALSRVCYVTVGVVLTQENTAQLNQTCRLAHDLGVADIRVIPAAQNGSSLQATVDDDLLAAHPILKYRMENVRAGKPVRGLRPCDPSRCPLVLDDVAVMGDCHYPCIIYLREHGDPIGRLGPQMRQERAEWARTHDTQADRICKANCIDVCVEYNRRSQEWNDSTHRTSTG